MIAVCIFLYFTLHPNPFVSCWLFVHEDNFPFERFTFIAELRLPEWPPSGAPYPCRELKETHELIFSWLSWLAVLFSRGCVRTTAMARWWPCIFQIIGWQRHVALVFLVLFRYMISCYDQLKPDKSSYPLTSTTWPYCGLKFISCRGYVFY